MSAENASRVRFARWVFLAAGIYGLIVMLPNYFLEERMGQDYPPAITHPEYFYGFVGIGVAWQVAFLIIATDPARYRPLLLPILLEKGSFGIAAIVLYLQGRVAAAIFVFGIIDLLLGGLFLAALGRISSPSPPKDGPA
jgi:hypothetical protein